MSENRRRGNKASKDGEKDPTQLSKENEAIAKFIRFNCPTKVGMFEGNEAHYFTGKKAVDTLFESKKYGSAAANPKFTSRQQAESFLMGLLHSRLFFRAKILVAKKKEAPRKQKHEKPGESPSFRRIKQAEESNDGESGTDTKKDESQSKKEEEKKKKKIKLVFHDNQKFNDDADVYVWVFDPTPLHKKIIGLLIVLGVILACLFPLWPDWLRLGVYYLSVTGISLFGLLLGVALLRTILFGIIYVCSMGRHNLWVLPNLTEDCGFFESFQPWYTYEYCAPGEDKKKEKKKKKESDEEPLTEDVSESTSKSPKSKKNVEETSPPPDPKQQIEEEHVNEETDPEEKYSKSGSDNSSAEEDEVSENDNQQSSKGSTVDSSDVVKIEDEASSKKESESTPVELTPAKPRRRRVRRADEDGFVMVPGGN